MYVYFHLLIKKLIKYFKIETGGLPFYYSSCDPTEFDQTPSRVRFTTISRLLRDKILSESDAINSCDLWAKSPQ